MKIIVVGNGGVGKTSLIRLYCQGLYTEQYKKTIGVDFLDKEMVVRTTGETINMMIWDTAGQEEFDTVTRVYYRGANACILAFSTIDRQSFEDLTSWRKKVVDECGPDIVCVLMQNKMDLVDQSDVTTEEVDALAAEIGVKVYRTSVKNNMNVQEIFEYLGDAHCRQKAKNTDEAVASAIGKGKGGQKGGEKFSVKADGNEGAKKKKKKKKCLIL